MATSLVNIYAYLRKYKGQEFTSRQLADDFEVKNVAMCQKLSRMRKDKFRYRKLVFKRRLKKIKGDRFQPYLVYKYEA